MGLRPVTYKRRVKRRGWRVQYGVILVVVPFAFVSCLPVVGEWWLSVPLLGWHYWTVLTNNQYGTCELLASSHCQLVAAEYWHPAV